MTRDATGRLTTVAIADMARPVAASRPADLRAVVEHGAGHLGGAFWIFPMNRGGRRPDADFRDLDAGLARAPASAGCGFLIRDLREFADPAP
jgi:hypothetical protein